MYMGTDYPTEEVPSEQVPFVPHARFWTQTSRVEVVLSPRRPRWIIRPSDEIEVYLTRGILGRHRLVGFTIYNVDGIRQRGVPLRGIVRISTILLALHRMEQENKERLFGKYQKQIEQALDKYPVTVSL